MDGSYLGVADGEENGKGCNPDHRSVRRQGMFGYRSKTGLVLAAFLAAVSCAQVARADAPVDVAFDVYRNGSPFGSHVVRFDDQADGSLQVRVDIELRAGFGPVTVFRYQHQSEEVWIDNDLVSLTASTLKDGEWTRVRLGPGDTQFDDLAGLTPSSHWSGYPPGLPLVLNTETGEPMPVEIEELGTESIPTPTGRIEARRIRMAGSVVVDLWYDLDGRWVGCAFSVRGQDIEYRLRDS